MSTQPSTPGNEHRQTAPTHVVELTPPGRAAVAVVLVSGPAAPQSVAECFTPLNGQPVDRLQNGRIVLGRWGGAVGEELIVCRRSDEQFEIHCHGGAAAVQSIINDLAEKGCVPATWQAWLRQNSPDAITAAAHIALADAVTERTAAILLDQLNGALAEAIQRTIDRVAEGNWPAAAESIDRLLARRELGLHLIRPWRVVVCGPPNVGKSSLINALAGFERAIVSPVPGTTRDVVTVITAIDGWPIELADTAGFRTTRDELESAGIELATTMVSAADLAIVVRDATSITDDNVNQGSWHTSELPTLPNKQLRVVNKVDLLPAERRERFSAEVNHQPSDLRDLIYTSAITGEGVQELAKAISQTLVPRPLPPGTPVPFAEHQFNQLAAARDAVEHHTASAATKILQAMLTENGGGRIDAKK